MRVLLTFRPKRPGLDRKRVNDKITSYRDLLEQEGYLHIPGPEVESLCNGASLRALADAAAGTPPDPYGNGTRCRCYRTATFYPWTGKLRFDDAFTDATGAT